MISELRVRLSELKKIYPASGYIFQMWQYALDNIDKSPEEIHGGNIDAIPYMPIKPEDFGCSLTPDSRILDIGCLGGYGLFDIAQRRAQSGLCIPRMTGIDIDPKSIEIANKVFQGRAWPPDAPSFIADLKTGNAEKLEFPDASFDLVIARLVLPYVDVKKSLGEMSRVLKPGGLLLVQLHGFTYYLNQLKRGFSYYIRPFISGCLFGVTGYQPKNKWFKETALSVDKLESVCNEIGLSKLWKNDNNQRPLMLLRKH